MYHYLFYRLYNHYQKGPFVWWSEWKAVLTIDILEFFIFLSGLNYYTIYFDKSFQEVDIKIILMICFGLFFLPNYFIFNHKEKWRKLMNEFNSLPKTKNIMGGWLILGFVIIVIANLIFSFYQMSLIDWSKYK